jgi:hypothetical protein
MVGRREEWRDEIVHCGLDCQRGGEQGKYIEHWVRVDKLQGDEAVLESTKSSAGRRPLFRVAAYSDRVT